MMSFATKMVQYMKKSLDVMKPFNFIANIIYFASPLGCYIEIPL